MKILITGTAGFIGFHLAKRMLEIGKEVVGLDNINDYYDISLKKARLLELGIDMDSIPISQDENKLVFHQSTKYNKHTFIKADLCNRNVMESVFREGNFDIVCNLAAQAGVRYSIDNPYAYIDSNVNGFINILEGCRNNDIKNLCYASSSSVYGLNKDQPFKTSDLTDTPISLYAATKKSNELMAHTYSHLYNIKATGLRFFTVYGPWGRPDMAPMLFTDAILNERPIKVFNHGNMSRDFTYIDDIIDGIVAIINNPSSNTIYNIGSSAPVSLMKFIESIEDALGKKSVKQLMDIQPGDVVSTYADISGLINDFNYKPATPLSIGVHNFINWYKEFYKKDVI